MGIFINILALIVIEWPALVIGYVTTAIKKGYKTGVFLHDRHEKAALDKFVYKVKTTDPDPHA
jgi:hypothetical protein